MVEHTESLRADRPAYPARPAFLAYFLSDRMNVTMLQISSSFNLSLKGTMLKSGATPVLMLVKISPSVDP